MKKSIANKLLSRIIIDPKIMTGKPVIKGTRIPVELIMRLIAQGISVEEILEDYPHLTRDDVKAVLACAAGVLANKEVYPVAPEEAIDT